MPQGDEGPDDDARELRGVDRWVLGARAQRLPVVAFAVGAVYGWSLWAPDALAVTIVGLAAVVVGFVVALVCVLAEKMVGTRTRIAQVRTLAASELAGMGAGMAGAGFVGSLSPMLQAIAVGVFLVLTPVAAVLLLVHLTSDTPVRHALLAAVALPFAWVLVLLFVLAGALVLLVASTPRRV